MSLAHRNRYVVVVLLVFSLVTPTWGLSVLSATDDSQFCTGCKLQSVYGACGQAEEFFDPCRCAAVTGVTQGDPTCAPFSIEYSQMSPMEVVLMDEYDNDDIPVKEDRICRVEYECDPGNI